MSEIGDILEKAIRDSVRELRAQDEWVSQDVSPIGKREHLRACSSGELPARKVGRLRLVRRSELDAYIEKHRVRVERKPTPAETEQDAELAKQRAVDELERQEPRRRARRSA